jgi:hypothetical protein
MTSADLVVIVGGIAAIAWVNWFFFVAGRPKGRTAKHG